MPFYEAGGFYKNGEMLIRQPAPISVELPEQLKGISKHMLVEHIGGKIIEVSPRHDAMPNNPFDKILNGVPIVPVKYVRYPNIDNDFGYVWRAEIIK